MFKDWFLLTLAYKALTDAGFSDSVATRAIDAEVVMQKRKSKTAPPPTLSEFIAAAKVRASRMSSRAAAPTTFAT